MEHLRTNTEPEPTYPRLPLGKDLHKIRISSKEMSILYRHRQLTGEPIQTFVRRLIREYPETYGNRENT